MDYQDALSETLDLLREIACRLPARRARERVRSREHGDDRPHRQARARHPDHQHRHRPAARGDACARAQRPPPLRRRHRDDQPGRLRGRGVHRRATARTGSTTPSSCATPAATCARSSRCAVPSPATARGSPASRRQQSATRQSLEASAWDDGYGLQKFNPMLEWTTEQVWAYIRTTGSPTTSSRPRLHQHRLRPVHSRGLTRRGPARRPLVVGDGRGQGVRHPRRPDDRSAGAERRPDVVPLPGHHGRHRGRTGPHHRRPSERHPDQHHPDQHHPEHDPEYRALRHHLHPRGPPRATTTPSPRTAATANHHEGKPMRVLILGGDGFCGWPTALHLSAQGHEVAIVDNLSRRKIDIELEVSSLTPIQPMGERLRTWKEVSGKDIAFHDIDVAVNYQRLLDLLEDWQPDALVHFAEQRAAPYSMKSSRAQALHGRATTSTRPTTCWPRSSRAGSTSTSCTSARWASTATAPPG